MIESVLRSRRSVRRFKPDPVPRELIVRLIEGAITAPSASNKQPWKFLIVESKPVIAGLAAAVREATARISAHVPEASRPAFTAYGDYFTRFEQAPVVVVPIFKPLTLLSNLVDNALPAADLTAIQQMESSSALIGTSLAIENLLLLAHDLGLGASGLTGPLVARAELARLLQVPASWDIAAFVALGYAAETPAATARKTAQQVIRWI